MFAKLSMVVVLAAVASAARLPPSHDKSALMARYILNEAGKNFSFLTLLL